MKKPKITEGEWEIAKYTNYVGWAIYAKGNGCVAERWEDSEYKNPHLEANAQAISAVPEMIDALIEARGYIQTKVDIFNEQYPDDTPRNALNKLEQIEQALIKAGCTE